ncbi:MAG: TolC family protein [Cytophagaceae bacterium]
MNLSAYSQQVYKDSLRISLSQADKRFLDNNLLLLAGRYGIEASQAQIIQAGLYDNTTLYVEQNVYNQFTGRYFDVTSSGETIVQIQQLIYLAGKRNKRIRLEQINSKVAEHEFFDLIRTLKYELRLNMVELFFLQRSDLMYQDEIAAMRQTVQLYQAQYERGNVSLKEVIRLKAFLFDLENERKDLLSEISERVANLQILLRDTSFSYIIPEISIDETDRIAVNNLSLNQLIDTARVNRHDLKIYETNINYEEANLAYQKALAVPDMYLGGVWDRMGNYIPNYFAVNVQIDIPAFNRNQGNIKAAKSRVRRSKAIKDEYETRVEAEVAMAFNKAIEYDNLYKNFDNRFAGDFDRLIEGIITSYGKRNISLLEFIDFYQSYKNTVIQMNQLQTNRMAAFEELNFYTGKSTLNY